MEALEEALEQLKKAWIFTGHTDAVVKIAEKISVLMVGRTSMDVSQLRDLLEYMRTLEPDYNRITPKKE